jgi:hypothetical protein
MCNGAAFTDRACEVLLSETYVVELKARGFTPLKKDLSSSRARAVTTLRSHPPCFCNFARFGRTLKRASGRSAKKRLE